MPKRPATPATAAAAAATAATAATHPIQIVTRRTGLSADVIRAWEKRYGVVAPVRSPNGRRLYSDADIERLRLLARATLDGRTIGQVAALSTRALAALVRGNAGRTTTPMGAVEADGRALPSPPAAREHLDAALRELEQFDGLALDLLLRRATVALSAAVLLDAVVVPLIERVATRIQDGTLRPAYRHLAHAVLRRGLDHVVATATTPFASPDLVVTTPSGQSDELGALVVAAAAAAEGWRVTYVGPGLPAEDIAETVTHVGARAVVLSLGTAPGDRVIPRELRRLRALLHPDVAILVEGAATDVHRSVLGEIRAVVVGDLPTLRAHLRMLHTAYDATAPRATKPHPPTGRRAAGARGAPPTSASSSAS